MPVFQDRKPPTFELANEGEYIARVVEFSIALSQFQDTRGCPEYEVKLLLEGTNSHVETKMTDHERFAWKIDAFVSCMNAGVKKGEAFEFNLEEARKLGVKWVDPIGLRGPVYVTVREFEYKSGAKKGQKGKANEIRIFYTDREKLPRHVEPYEEPAGNDADEVIF